MEVFPPLYAPVEEDGRGILLLGAPLFIADSLPPLSEAVDGLATRVDVTMGRAMRFRFGLVLLELGRELLAS